MTGVDAEVFSIVSVYQNCVLHEDRVSWSQCTKGGECMWAVRLAICAGLFLAQQGGTPPAGGSPAQQGESQEKNSPNCDNSHASKNKCEKCYRATECPKGQDPQYEGPKCKNSCNSAKCKCKSPCMT